MNNTSYIFTSERLGFRTWREEDIDDFLILNSDEVVMEHFPDTMTRAEVAMFIEKLQEHYATYGYTYYAVELLGTQDFIGMIGLASQQYVSTFTPAIDIGWRLKRSAWGYGYATEGARRCLQYAFDDLDIDKVISVCTIGNAMSENVMGKIGMSKIGEFDHPEMSNHPALERHLCYEIVRVR